MKLFPAHQVRGRLRLPGDKSISHRAALIAALADGPSEITNFSTARDCAATLACLRELGVSIEASDGKLSFAGNRHFTPPSRPLDCGNSGSTMRILAGVLAAHDLTAELIARKVLPDFRAPDSVRIGLSPLTTSFEDVHRGLSALNDVLS